MAQQIQLRRDTAANWTSADPVLASGEIGIETDTVKVKIGDGTTAWTSLSYFGGTGSGTVDTAGTPVANDFARFTDANTIEGRSYSETRSDLGLGSLATQDDIAVPGDITATGTPSATTYLRGDGSWSTPSGAGTVDTSGTPVTNDIARFTDADTIEGLSYTEFLAAIATGTPSSSTYLRGDGTWSTPSGAGTVDTSGTPVANDIARFTDADTIEGLSYTEFRTAINVEDGADVTDATNVAAAGAVMESDTSTASMSFVVDEDTMSSDSATKVPTQQSVKAYVDAAITALKAEVYVLVNHGSTASTSRPTGYAGVIWYGSVQPTNITGQDFVIRTDEAV
jgi:hypothetical protein